MSDIDQRWLITYQPWSNVRKHNNRWTDGNNKNIPYNVIERYKWHACAYYEVQCDVDFEKDLNRISEWSLGVGRLSIWAAYISL